VIRAAAAEDIRSWSTIAKVSGEHCVARIRRRPQNTFLVTIIVTGASTFLVAFIPSFATVGWAAPVVLVTLRLLQGLALGDEYGGAARAAVPALACDPAPAGLFLGIV
jgi:MFS family permease